MWRAIQQGRDKSLIEGETLRGFGKKVLQSPAETRTGKRGAKCNNMMWTKVSDKKKKKEDGADQTKKKKKKAQKEKNTQVFTATKEGEKKGIKKKKEKSRDGGQSRKRVQLKKK